MAMCHALSDPLHVVVLSGGRSAEREVSLQSGRSVAAALRALGHRVTRIDPARTDVERLDATQTDACFIALHGGEGEDGRIQTRLMRIGIPFTGSDPAASALAMSKRASKRRFVQAGVPTPAWNVVGWPLSRAPAAAAARLGWPVVVKPDEQGSSLGVHIAGDEPELLRGLADAARFGSTILIERYIAGRELTVTLLDDQSLGVLEIRPARGWYDYHAKYECNDTKYDGEPELPMSWIGRITRTAVRAAGALGTRGLVRVDIRLDAAGVAWVLEVNTAPGMTGHSLAPKTAERAGLPMPVLCERLVQMAIDTARRDSAAPDRRARA
jgi:D-alanine-D-alanine ligase